MQTTIKLTALCIAGLALATLLATHFVAQGNSEIQAELNMSPVPLDTRRLNIALVAKGSYLVNGPGNCSTCHTAGVRFLVGGDPFQGQTKLENTMNFLGGNKSFGGILSRNLTPDKDGLPEGLTLAQFISIMRTGNDLKGPAPFTPSASNDLLQVMPWPQYQNLTNDDLRGIYEYLKAIECVPGGPSLSATRCN
jgi:hypothetical protein